MNILARWLLWFKAFLSRVLDCIAQGMSKRKKKNPQYFHFNSLSSYWSELWAKSQAQLWGCWSSQAVLMGRCWSCKWQCLAHLSVFMKCSWKQITSWMFTPECHPRCVFSRPCFYKLPKGKYTASLPTLLLCVNKCRKSLCRAGTRARSTRACFLRYLREVSIIHIHEHIPAPAFPQEHCFTNSKGRNRNQEPR